MENKAFRKLYFLCQWRRLEGASRLFWSCPSSAYSG